MVLSFLVTVLNMVITSFQGMAIFLELTSFPILLTNYLQPLHPSTLKAFSLQEILPPSTPQHCQGISLCSLILKQILLFYIRMYLR